MSETEVPDCPLCMETFEIDDINFFPCTCEYQVCRFCWHRIRTDENGLCPACRKAYPEDPAMYQPLSQDEVQKKKKERKHRDVQQKQKTTDSRQHLSNIRVIQKHLVFVVGLSNKMADSDVLKKQEYFGKYGKILKIVINPNTNYAGPQGPSASAYVTYSREDEALRTILSINNMQPPLKIRASLGTTKYCTHYLRNTICPKQDCMYLHDVGDMNASFTKEDMQAGKHQLFEKDLLDNYMLSVQKQKQSYNHEPFATNQHGVSEDAQAWSEGENDNTAMLPSNASWASKDDKDKKVELVQRKSRNNSISIDYPSIEASSAKISATVRPTTPSRDRKDSGSIATDTKLPPTTQQPKQTKRQISAEDWDTPPEPEKELPPPTKQQQKVPKKDNPSPPTLEEETTTTKPVVSSMIPIQPPQQTATAHQPHKNTQKPPPTSINNIVTATITTTTTAITTTSMASSTTTGAANPSWPLSFDLGLSDLQLQSNDDELGFDPFKESKSGLEDLIAIEQREQALAASATSSLSSASSPSKSKPAFSWESFWPTNYGNGNMTSMMDPASSYSLFNSAVSQNTMRPQAPAIHYDTTGQMSDPNNSGGYPFSFSNSQTSSSSQHPTVAPGHPLAQLMSQQQVPPSMINYGGGGGGNTSSRYPFMSPTPSIGATALNTQLASGSHPPPPGVAPNSDKNWQDGLRALLPNINISFASLGGASSSDNNSNNNENLSLSQQMSAATTSQQPVAQQHQHEVQPSSITGVPSVASPPPGFSGILGNFETNAKPSWLLKGDQQLLSQQSGTTPSTSNRVPVPPPGFRSPVIASVSATTSPNNIATVVTTTYDVVTTHTTSFAKNIPQHPYHQQQHQQKRHSQHFGSHEDPSILWSKVLSDKPTREIETTTMVFPLPGETVDQALNSASTPPQQTSQHNQHMMSWNSVVSGNNQQQYGKSPTGRDLMEPCTVNTNTSPPQTKEGVISNNNKEKQPQKPSPIFGSQQKHAVKKPTAHVKPLKCNPPPQPQSQSSEQDGSGFTTVHGGSSSTRSAAGAAGSGSRVSELDDFSADLRFGGGSSRMNSKNVNIRLTANVVSNSIVDYPPAHLAQTALNSGDILGAGTPSTKSKKKKSKKGKDQSAISEVLVGMATQHLTTMENFPSEEERPKKGKNKKKNKGSNSSSVSPPIQRKGVDYAHAHHEGVVREQQQQPQAVRILKSDACTSHSAAQPVDGSAHGGHSSHEHELAVSRLTESTEKLLKNVLFETEAIKLNTEQISKDLKSALEKCKESSLSLSDLEKINMLLTPGKLSASDLDDPDLVDTTDLERQVESARREAKLLEARLNDVIRKNMASELETLKRNTKSS